MDAQDGATLNWSDRPLPTLNAMIAAKEKGVVGTLKSRFSHHVEVTGMKKVDGDRIAQEE